MKKILLITALLNLLVFLSCSRSEFSTTTRHSRDGKVYYTNRYPVETIRLKKIKPEKNSPVRTEMVKKTTLASGSDKPGLSVAENKTTETVSGQSGEEPGIMATASTDTIRKSLDTDPMLRNLPATRIIKLTSGGEKVVLLLKKTNDTLLYQLLDDPDATRYITMREIESVRPDTRTTEKHGVAAFFLSILGFIPFIGIPFAIAAIILAAKSASNIRKFPVRYKGDGLGHAGKVLSVLALIFNILVIIVALTVASTNVSTSRCSCIESNRI
jgi:hypothetical protein